MELRCPLCGEWIAYPHNGQTAPKGPRILRRRRGDPDWVYKAFLFHLRKQHAGDLRKLFPEGRTCPFCGKEIKPVPNRPGLEKAIFMNHVLMNHTDEVVKAAKDKLGVDLSLSGLERREEQRREPEAPTVEHPAPQKAESEPKVTVEAAPSPKPEVTFQVFPSPQEPSGEPEGKAQESAPEPQAMPPATEKPTSATATPEPKVVIEETHPEVFEEPKPEEPEKEGELSTSGSKKLDQFEKKPLLEFLRERIQPFHIAKKPATKKAREGEKPERKKGTPLFLYILGIGALGAVGYGIYRYIKAKKEAQASLQQAQPGAQTETTLNPGPNTESNPVVEEPPPGPRIGPDGRFYSARWADKNIY